MVKSATRLVLGLLLVATGVLYPTVGFTLPSTLASTHLIGNLGTSATFDPSFPVDYLGVSVASEPLPHVRLLTKNGWSEWISLEEDDVPFAQGRLFSALVYAADADAVQLRGPAADVRAVAINTTDGPLRPSTNGRVARADHLSQPPILSRADWGANESYRFNADGTEKWPPAFYPTQKLVVHHTATKNDDPDPAATVRAIYRYHAIDKGWGDIGYNFLVDEQGVVYKGRYSGAGGTSADTFTGEDDAANGVTAAHVGGYNSGTMGIALLGTLTDRTAAPSARASLIDHLAWEAERHGLDPEGTSLYVNPVDGKEKLAANISGHRDWGATECPGDTLYSDLPSIRSAAADKIAGTSDSTAPTAPQNLTATGGIRKVSLSWIASTDDRGVSGYEIWRSSSDGGSGFSLVGTTSSTTYTDTGLRRRQTFWYYVVAFDAAGNRSEPSNTTSARA